MQDNLIQDWEGKMQRLISTKPLLIVAHWLKPSRENLGVEHIYMVREQTHHRFFSRFDGNP
jgi:hypothetical protein